MRNRNTADRTLLGVFLLFLLLFGLKLQQGEALWLQMAYATAEAALIGGIADWFAVTALFRRPLGFPWHTALIPRNRQRIVEGAVRTVERELLSQEVLAKRLSEVKLAQLFVEWGDSPRGQKLLKEMVIHSGRELLAGIDTKGLAALLGQVVKKYLKEADPRPLLQGLLGWLQERGYIDRWVEALLAILAERAADPETRRQLEQQLTTYAQDKTQDSAVKRFFCSLLEAVDAINYQDAAAAIQVELVAELREMQSRDHVVRRWLQDRLRRLGQQLQDDPDYGQGIRNWQGAVVERLSLEPILRDLLEAAIASARQELTAEDCEQPICLWVEEQFDVLWGGFRTNEGLQMWLDGILREGIEHFLLQEQQLVGAITRRAFDALTEERLNAFIEEKAGEDLQWIRINGSVVGGLIGLALFLLQYFVLRPWLPAWG